VLKRKEKKRSSFTFTTWSGVNWEVVIKHSYWEANKCADVLANIGCNLDSHTIFYAFCPRECFDVMLAM
jgi:hypothetical protein